jgi:hypothetical protein
MLLIPSFVIPLTVDIQNRPTVPHNWVIWYVCVPSLKPTIKVASNSPNPLFLCLLDEYIRFIAGRRICRGQRETGDGRRRDGRGGCVAFADVQCAPAHNIPRHESIPCISDMHDISIPTWLADPQIQGLSNDAR